MTNQKSLILIDLKATRQIHFRKGIKRPYSMVQPNLVRPEPFGGDPDLRMIFGLVSVKDPELVLVYDGLLFV